VLYNNIVFLQKSQVNHILRKYATEGEVGLESKRANCGGKIKISEEEMEQLRASIIDRPFSAAQSLQENLQLRCTVRTVQRALHRLGIHHRQPAKKILLSEEHAAQSLQQQISRGTGAQ